VVERLRFRGRPRSRAST